MSKIIAIELENFQAIEKRSRIEFKPITLLYGPNSAGKSAVFDAIELIE
jgi:DNA repair exonuclease SbcCD ATPase subunit